MKAKVYAEYLPAAKEHAAADGRCGRTWQCQCGACLIIRRDPMAGGYLDCKSLNLNARREARKG